MTNENELVERAKNGDTSAYDELIEKNIERIYRMAYAMLNNKEDTEDVVQETFIKAWQKIGDFRGESSFSTWVSSIATRICISRYRKKKIFITIDELLPILHNHNPINEIEQKDEWEKMQKAMNKLSPKEKIALTLKMEGQKIEEISKIMNVAEGTVKSLLHRATKKIRNALGIKYEM